MSAILAGIESVFTWETIPLILGGTVLGAVVGAVPGLTATMAVSLALPITFRLSPLAGLAFMLAIYKSGVYGGSISAVLLGIPGTPSNAATVLDGYPLAKQGKALKALKLSLVSSFIGDTFSDLMVVTFAGLLVRVALLFGPSEYFAVSIFALTTVASISGKSLLKGMVGASFGALVATIGIAPIHGIARFSFGSVDLTSGISLLPMLIGLFAVSEMLSVVEGGVRDMTQVALTRAANPGDNRLSWREIKSCANALATGSVLGTLTGVLPGMGASVACWLGYSEAKRRSRRPDLFGKGSLEGIAAAESANNAVCGANILPLLTLGIPGDAVAAMMLGVFIIHGITPGPMLFRQHAPLVYGLYAVLLACNVAYLVLGYYGVGVFARVVSISKRIVVPVVLVLCLLGSYAFASSMFDAATALVFGIIGFALRKADFDLAPVLVGFILEPIAEAGLGQALTISHGRPGILFLRPVAGVIWMITLVTVGYLIMRNRRSRKLERRAG